MITCLFVCTVSISLISKKSIHSNLSLVYISPTQIISMCVHCPLV
jgi:hypothetical protein